MADLVTPHPFVTDIALAINNKPTPFGFDFVKGEAESHEISITVQNGGVDVSLSGATCMIYVVRSADGGTVDFAADVVGSVMSKAMPAECFSYARPITILATATIGGITRVTLFRQATVRDGITDVVIDPGSAIPNLAELLAAIADVEAATTAAEEATALIRYTFVKYSAINPTQNSDMKDTADAWIGVYNGTSQTAPTAYTSYLWYEIKGADGDPGADFVILGTYADLTALRAAVPSPTAGLFYNVGAASPYNVYRSTGLANPNDWEDNGTLQATTLAADMTIADAGGYFTSENVEGALQEVGLGKVSKSLFDAHSILAATSDNTPAAVTIAEQRVLGRLTGGNIDDIAIGIADDNILQVDQADAADNDFARFTANGLEGRSYAEVLSDIGAQAKATITENTDAAPALGTIANNTEYRCTHGTPTDAPSMTIASIAANTTEFACNVIYKAEATSPSAPAVTNNSGKTIKYQGDGVSGGTFTPVAGTVYRMGWVWDGVYLNCYIKGV